MVDMVADLISVVEEFRVPMTLADPDLNDCPLLFANSAFEDLTGFSGSSLVGKNCRFLQGEKIDKTETSKIKTAIENRLSCISALTNYTSDGRTFHNLLMINPILLRNGKCLLVGCQFRFDRG